MSGWVAVITCRKVTVVGGDDGVCLACTPLSLCKMRRNEGHRADAQMVMQPQHVDINMQHDEEIESSDQISQVHSTL